MNFNELLSNPSMMHAAVVHLPIAGAVFGLLFIAISAVFHKNNVVRAMTALLFLLVSVTSYIAIETGEDARSEVPNTVSKAISDQISEHAGYAENVMYAAIFTLACLLLSLIRIDAVRIAGLLLAAIGAIVTNVLVAETGHLGGMLVYKEGVGTPFIHQPAAPPVAEIPAAPPMVETPAETEPAPVNPEPAPAPEAAPPAPVVPVEPAPVADNPEWVPIRDFTMEEAQQVSYIRDIWPIIDDQCIVCHEDPDADGEFVMTTVAETLKGGKKGGPGLIPGNPDESSMVKYIRGILNPRMPEDEPPLDPEMLHKIRMWIAAGAIDDTNGTPEAAAPAAEAAPVEVPAAVKESEAPSAPTEAPAVEAPATDPAPADTSEVAPAAAESTPEPAVAETVTETPAATSEATVTASTPEAAGDPAAESTPAETTSDSSASTTEPTEPATAP
jgi:uncharacterized membrane protein